MPYYHGRWHAYSEAERREYGRAKREERSRAWHDKWLSRSGLKARLWTDKAIAEFLGKPRDAGPVKAWPRSEVLKVEKTRAFKDWMTKRRAWLTARNLLPPGK
jgi:hypothetical protein